jgi:CubicO group peptidase (beta-lactamase class C family)
MIRLSALLLFASFLCSCKKSGTEVKEKVFSQEQMQSAANYSKQKGGTAVVVMQNGQIIFENYHNGANENTPTHIQSGTKGFFAAVVALAIQEGLITGYDENVSTTITEWQNATQHPGKKQITIRHLVSLTSGLSQDLDYIQGEHPLAPDIYDYVVNNLRLLYSPGTKFQYGPSHYYVFGVFLKRKLQQAGINLDPLQYLETRLLQKIGITYTSWAHDQAGNPHIPNGCYITPRNWTKFGQFLLQKGKWNNEQLTQENFINDVFVPKGDNQGHGAFIWLNKPGGDATSAGMPAVPTGSEGGIIYYKGYTDMVGALGAGKNRLYVIPSLNAVIVRQSTGDNGEFSDNDFLDLILPK